MNNRPHSDMNWINLNQTSSRQTMSPGSFPSGFTSNGFPPNGMQANGLPSSNLPPNAYVNMMPNPYYIQQPNEGQMCYHAMSHHHPVTVTPPGYGQPDCHHDYEISHQVISQLPNMPYGYLSPETQMPSPPMTVSGSESSPGTVSRNSNNTSPSAQTIPRAARTRDNFEWMNKPSYQSQPNPGKTRTKDKYRVVYTDHQRVELEKEFYYSRYITIRRKSELARTLGLSERQVKIWFQNRRAKERKQVKKREEMSHKENVTINQQHNVLASQHVVSQGIIPVPIM